MQSAKRHAGIFAPQGPGNRLAQGGLAHPGRAVEAEDGRLQVALQLQHRQVLQYSLLDLFQSIVIFIKHALCIVQVKVIISIFIPWQLQQGLYIVDLHRVFGGGGIKAGELVKLAVEDLCHILTP